MKGCIFEGIKMEEHQKEYIKLLDSGHLPSCVWLTSKSDSQLGLDKGFFL